MPQDHVGCAADGAPFDDEAVPETVTLAADRARLRLIWPNGQAGEIASARLRAACRCAWCTRARHDGTFAASFHGVAVERLMPIGGYALNIAFTDGHARGVYPWVYLRALATQSAAITPPPAPALQDASAP